MPSAFIDDGYTLTATLSGENYDPFDITYRPLVRSEHFKYSEEVRKWTDGESIKREHMTDYDILSANAIAGNNGWTQKLLSWTLKDSEDKPVGITTDNLMKLHPDAFSDLLDVFFPSGDKKEDAAKN